MEVISKSIAAIQSEIAASGSTLSGDNIISNISVGAIRYINEGDLVVGTNVPAESYVVKVDRVNGAIEINNNCTGTSMFVLLSFYQRAQGIEVRRFAQDTGYGPVKPVSRVNWLGKNSLTVDADGWAMLLGDQFTPGSGKVYATNSLGNKGWHDIATLLGLRVYHTENYTTTVSTTSAGLSVTVLSLNSLAAGNYLIFASMKADRNVADGNVTMNLSTPINILINEVLTSVRDSATLNFHAYFSSGSTFSFNMDAASSVLNGAIISKRTLTAIKIG